MISATALADAQTYLRENALDGWLLADFQHGNPVFDQVVGRRHTTRRCFLLVPPQGPIVPSLWRGANWTSFSAPLANPPNA